MPNTQNLATVGVTNRQDTDNIIVEQGGNIRRVQYEDIKTGILRGDAADGTISTFEESAEEFPIPAPATPQKTLWGRVKKFCSDFNDWKTGVMLFGHLVNNAESDSDTLPLAASVAKLLQEQITTNAGAIATLNSDFDIKLTQTGKANFNYGRCTKVGKVVSFVLSVTKTSLGYEVASGMPKPLNGNMNQFIINAVNDQNNPVMGYITHDGQLCVVSIDSGTYILSGTYISE